PQAHAGARAEHGRSRGHDRVNQATLRSPAAEGVPMIQIAILLALSVVGVAMLLSLWRLLRGPTAPDRLLALDTLYVNAVAQLILFGMVLDSEIYFEVALIIAMLGFFGTVVLSKYVIRRDIVE